MSNKRTSTGNDKTCSDAEHRRLQDDINKKCKDEPGVKLSCGYEDSCATLSSKAKRWLACHIARNKINITCFNGGNSGHIQQTQEALRASVKCKEIFLEKCGKKQPEPVPVPVPIPVPDESFMRKMEVATGLTGAALVIYLIISEGSRLFPPRNLIPIP